MIELFLKMVAYVIDTIFGYCPSFLLVPFVLLILAWWPMAGFSIFGSLPIRMFLIEWGVAIAWAGVCLIAGIVRRYVR